MAKNDATHPATGANRSSDPDCANANTFPVTDYDEFCENLDEEYAHLRRILGTSHSWRDAEERQELSHLRAKWLRKYYAFLEGIKEAMGYYLLPPSPDYPKPNADGNGERTQG